MACVFMQKKKKKHLEREQTYLENYSEVLHMQITS